MNLPNDADGDALRRLIHDGSDLSRPMTVEFTVDVPTREAGEAIARAAKKAGYVVSVEMDEEDGAWTCYCARHMIAAYHAVVEAQQKLNRLSEPHGGFCDGWGSFGNALGVDG